MSDASTEEARKELWVDQQRTSRANRRRILAMLRGDRAATQTTRDNWEPVTDYIAERRADR